MLDRLRSSIYSLALRASANYSPKRLGYIYKLSMDNVPKRVYSIPDRKGAAECGRGECQLFYVAKVTSTCIEAHEEIAD